MTDALDPAPVAALSTVLDLPAPLAAAGEPLLPQWHWLYFLTWPRHSQLAPDGHPTEGQLLPPLARRRRMFAGGRLDVRAPLIIGAPADLVSRVAGVRHKHGRAGELLFVTVASEISQGGQLRMTEEQNLVYLGAGYSPAPGAETPPPDDAPWRLAVPTDPALLFRISALTANTHRIHYDAP